MGLRTNVLLVVAAVLLYYYTTRRIPFQITRQVNKEYDYIVGKFINLDIKYFLSYSSQLLRLLSRACIVLVSYKQIQAYLFNEFNEMNSAISPLGF